jgi:hypothetical protein
MKVSQLDSGFQTAAIRSCDKEGGEDDEGEGGTEQKRRKTVCKPGQVFSIALLISDKKEPENVINYEFQASHRTLLLLHRFFFIIIIHSFHVRR